MNWPLETTASIYYNVFWDMGNVFLGLLFRGAPPARVNSPCMLPKA